MKARYTVRCAPQSMNGEPGWSYWIRDYRRQLVAEGWSRGSKTDALDDARGTIGRLSQFDLSDAEASS